MRVFRRMAWAGLALVVALAGYLGVLQLTGNFHEVVPGGLYRSAQVTPDMLERAVRDHGLRSVLNLRGAAPDRDWYQAERAAEAELGLVHRDFAMSDRRQMSGDEMRALIAAMRDMPRPLLIHCRAGADRTGLAAALYLAAIEQAPEETAEAQLSLRYGHVSVPLLSRAWPMNLSFEDLEPRRCPENS